MKKLTALTLTLAVSLLAAGCSAGDEAAPAPESSQSQSAAGPESDGPAEGMSAAPQGTETGSWDSKKYPERVGSSSKEFLLSAEYGVWEAGKAWYVTGGTWDPKAVIDISITTAPDGEVDAGKLADFVSEEAGTAFSVTAGEDGTFETGVNVPADTAPGNYVITATDAESGTSQGQVFQVVAPE